MRQAFPVVNLRMGQGSQMISTKDFNAFYDYALAQVTAAAEVALRYDVSTAEEDEVRRAVGNIEQYTIPMSNCPTPSAEASCPIFPPGAPPAGGIPWWAAAAAGLGVGAAVVGLLA